MMQADDFQLVMPTSQASFSRLARVERITLEREMLREWEKTKDHWSGM